MAIPKKVKYRKNDQEQIDLGVKVMVEAYGYSKKTKHRIDAVKKATKKLSPRERAELPEDSAINGHLKTLIDLVEAKKFPTDDQYGYQIVIKNAYMEITKGQISVNELCDLESEPTEDQLAELNDTDFLNVVEEIDAPDEDPDEDELDTPFAIIKGGRFYRFLTKARFVQFNEGFVIVEARREDWEALF